MSIRSIGIDVGYGRTKMFVSERCNANFPSAVSSQIPTDTFSDDSNKYHFVEVRGITYIVGHEAEIHALSLEDSRRSDFVCSPSWFALLGNALRVADFDAFRDIITVGLPPGDLGNNKRQMLIKEIQETPMRMTATGKTYSLERVKIFVLPQGAGIYLSHAIDFPEVLNKKVVVVDLGHQTLDIIFMDHGKYIEKRRKTKDLGVSHQLDEIISLERSRWQGKDLGYAELVARYEQNHALITDGAPENIPGAADILKGYTRSVLSTIEAYLSATHGADIVLIGGGGAKFLLPDRDYKFLVVGNPEMANAIGYSLWGATHASQ